MAAVLLQGPAIEPVSLTEAKNYLRVEHGDDDALIGELIIAGRVQVEQAARRVLITQSWRIVKDHWPASGWIVSPVNPLQTIEAARVLPLEGEALELDLDAFTLNAAAAPAIIAFERGAVKQPGRTVGGIEIDVTAGYADAADDIPAPLRQAIRFLVARNYEQRDRVEKDELPDAVAALIAAYRVAKL
jgi:uncharacterized phiE125 gp8 family phage protein